MIQFDRLRIHGFKSFVDRTELEIGPGLNGVVGPNGCGKSNLVEALRWVMGESSAKRMRGGGMEDVIFNGTEKRARRNIAEVSLLMDNKTRTAPALYNKLDEIEIIRRIERDKGSNYKINGKNARARDVQMLFADTVTGANSPALVSQGRVTEMINAKPLDRRMILEESAGISGLFARRHEAELRLKAADNNLQRLQDLMGSMEGRLSSLKRQARQASRYKSLSAQIRQIEILIAHMEWSALDVRMKDTRHKFDEAESVVADRMAVVTQLTKAQTTQSHDLPELRKAEAEAAAALQAQKIALQRLEDEAEHQAKMLKETESQFEQTQIDHGHAENEIRDNTEVSARIETEQTNLIEEQKYADEQLKEKSETRDSLEGKVLDLEARYNALMQSTAEIKAERDSITRRMNNNQQRFDTLVRRKESAANELEAVKSNKPAADEDYEAQIEALDKRTDEVQALISEKQAALENIAPEIEEARSSLREKESKKSEFVSEINVLESFINSDSEEDYSPILDAVTPNSGFEKALSRALGDSLMASLDEMASSSWLSPKTERANLPALPAGCEPLLPRVKAPKTLNTALSQIGVVDDDAQGHALWELLQPGQSLVSKDGTYWRWDGYNIKAEATDRHAQHLEQKNRLAALNERREEIEKAASDAEQALSEKLEAQSQIQSTLKDLNAERGEIIRKLNEKRSAFSALREKLARSESNIQRLEDSLKTTHIDIADIEKLIKEDNAQLKAYDEKTSEEQDDELETLKTSLAETRSAYGEAVRAYDLTQQQQNTRQARLHAIADERINLQNRSIRARERVKELEQRKSSLEEKLKILKAQPSDFEDKKDELLINISNFEKERDKAAENLATVEAAVAETTRALKAAESTLGEAREVRASSQAMLGAMQEQRNEMKRAIEEKFEMAPESLRQQCAQDADGHLPAGTLEEMRSQRESLLRERDSIGPVNLRAEDEMSTLEGEVGTMLHERNDLEQAIEELRSGIQKINIEARERLLNAFEHVNAHFSRLFVQLFGGGAAHLALIDSDDPLQSGLEIFAQPPGKALQSLSLLSGGEQTMASIALIFAMFLTNPSPICVLDEIDAPLDDANVDRVCDLLDEIAERGETRFLVITHHRLTMARMDRLYGVTMGERGVSQLVSVDLQQSFDFVEAA